MEMNDLNRGTNIDDDKADERQSLLAKSPGTPAANRGIPKAGILGNFVSKGGD